MATRRAPIFGPEAWAVIGGVTWSHWDRWYSAVCLTEADGDWSVLAEVLAARFGRVQISSDAEAKLSHLDDLAAGLDKEELAKARRKVLDQGLSGRDLAPAMRHTPRRRLRERALHGSWASFPVDPSVAYAVFEADVEEAGHVGKGGTFELVRELEAQIASVVDDAADDPARMLSARRAALTAVQQVAHRVDDSYGVVGELGQASWKGYVGTPWWDLVAPARKADLPFILHSLRALAEEYVAARLPYHADRARVALAYAHVATASLTAYATVARDVGSEHWMPVVALAESALLARRPDVAAAVFDAADQPGAHRDHLRRRRAALLDG